jgi:hypothetical protein
MNNSDLTAFKKLLKLKNEKGDPSVYFRILMSDFGKS